MDRIVLKQSLDGGYIEEYSLDICANLFTMGVDVLDGETLSRYEVRFEHVTHFRIDSESRGIKGRLELTEIWIDESPEASSSEEWGVTISMWDMTHMTIKCAVILVDGHALR